MNIFTRTLISTFPLLCAVGALAAPVAAHPGAGTPAAPVCSGGGAATAPERHGAAAPTPPPRSDAAPVPVRVTVRDLTTAPNAGERGRVGAPVEVEIVVRGGGGGSAAGLPAALRDLVQTLITPQRVPAPRPHR
ncbi:hypothetical protein ACFWM1_32570 [Nocardia sp. NPDC058379]|uniref:hypothetical protein n=1 Tax=unclassified Nocardia TaxID=2637762 RepID=UPI003647DAE8